MTDSAVTAAITIITAARIDSSPLSNRTSRSSSRLSSRLLEATRA